jgi:uncharacterized cupredoxin-like copper-binding protein
MSTFDPVELTIPADTDVTLRVVNDGVAVHNLSLNVAGVTTPVLEANEEYELVLNLPAGNYAMGCDVPGHRIAGMTGILHVVD